MDVKFHLDSNGNDITVEHIQDVEPILEHNKMLRTVEQRSDWGRHIGKIPLVTITKWLHEEWARGNTTIRLSGPEMDALIARKLKDGEWSRLRADMPSLQIGFGS